MGDVRVVVRFRPQQDRELVKGGAPICKFEPTGKSVTMNGQRKAAFTFDRVFNMQTQQKDIYMDAAKPVVDDVLKGYNGTIFAYGQTSSGKTFTMEGPDHFSEKKGVIPRIIDDIFNFIYMAPEVLEFKIKISYFEIYMEKIRDLLIDGNENLQIHESRDRGVYVRNATEVYAQSPEEVLDYMHQGAIRRSVANTNMNDVSSRSHAVMLIEIEQTDTEKGGKKTGKLYMVDLAGSEKVSKTGADGEVLEEAKNINKSLSALGLVIMTLTDGNPKAHIPYRDSKLTRILQESLGGNARTCIIICCSPSSYNEQESLSSLQFGKRAKKIKNKAKINIQYSAEELQKQLEQAKREINRLTRRIVAYENELKIWRSGGTVSEEERMTLMEDSTSAGSPQKGGSAPTSAAQVGIVTMTEEETEEIQRREKELLDLLDEKDDEIHTLEKEVEQMSQEKVTITKLAAENMHFQEQVKALEGFLDQVQEDNATFELSIERLAAANEEFQLENQRIKEETKELGSKMEKKEVALRKQLDQVSEALTGLYSGQASGGGRRLPAIPGEEAPQLDPTVDSNLTRVRGHIDSLNEEINSLKAAQGTLSETNEARLVELETVKKSLDSETLKAQQLDRDHNSLKKEKDALEVKVAEMEGKCEGLQNQVQDLILKMVEAEIHHEQKTNREEQDLNDMKSMLDSEQQKVKEAHAAEVASLKSKMDTMKQENSSILSAKDALERDLLNAKSDLENERSHVAALQDKVEKLNVEKEQVKSEALSAREFQPETKEQVTALSSIAAALANHLKSRTKELQEIPEDQGIDTSATNHVTHRAQVAIEEADNYRSELLALKKQVNAKKEANNNMVEQLKALQTRYKEKCNELSAVLKRMERQRRGSTVKGVRGGMRDPRADPHRASNVGVRGGARPTQENRSSKASVRGGSLSNTATVELNNNPEDVEYV